MQSKTVKYREQLNKLETDKLKYEEKLTDINKKIKEVNLKLNEAINEEKMLIFERLLKESELSLEELEALFKQKDLLLNYMKTLATNNSSKSKSNN
ncbi:MAG: hypothetical protein Q4D26_10980 [Clostridia bacterium]|nr:hypothetical protein [Clostridia bacterium]